MVRYQDTLWCDGCGIEILWEPEEKSRLFFCCQECLEGNSCSCSIIEDDLELDDQSNTLDLETSFQ